MALSVEDYNDYYQNAVLVYQTGIERDALEGKYPGLDSAQIDVMHSTINEVNQALASGDMLTVQEAIGKAANHPESQALPTEFLASLTVLNNSIGTENQQYIPVIDFFKDGATDIEIKSRFSHLNEDELASVRETIEAIDAAIETDASGMVTKINHSEIEEAIQKLEQSGAIDLDGKHADLGQVLGVMHGMSNAYSQDIPELNMLQTANTLNNTLLQTMNAQTIGTAQDMFRQGAQKYAEAVANNPALLDTIQNWDQKDPDERMFGVSKSIEAYTESYGIPNPVVMFLPAEKMPAGLTAGYVHENGVIYIDQDFAKGVGKYEGATAENVLHVINHELSHSYQRSVEEKLLTGQPLSPEEEALAHAMVSNQYVYQELPIVDIETYYKQPVEAGAEAAAEIYTQATRERGITAEPEEMTAKETPMEFAGLGSLISEALSGLNTLVDGGNMHADAGAQNVPNNAEISASQSRMA